MYLEYNIQKSLAFCLFNQMAVTKEKFQYSEIHKNGILGDGAIEKSKKLLPALPYF